MKSSHLVMAGVLASIAGILFVGVDYDAGVRRWRFFEPGLGDEGEMPSLSGATLWLNSEPLTPADLRGKVVLFDFWTFTCINWIRHAPYVRAWAEKYRDQGLIVIGVHTPEFDFERDVDNVRRAVTEMDVDYPVIVDSDYTVWHAFKNNYWPALYFVDARGTIRHHQFGEGDYGESERVLQRLLAEAGSDVSEGLVSVKPRAIEVAADWGELKSSETYLGYQRGGKPSSPGGAIIDRNHAYSAPASLRLNQWALSGDWTIGRQAAVLNGAGGRILYRFHARDLHLVMGPATRGSTVRFRLLVDGRPPGDAHGGDVDADGYGVVTEQRLYQLIREPDTVEDRDFEIEFLDPGVEAFAFTFG